MGLYNHWYSLGLQSKRFIVFMPFISLSGRPKSSAFFMSIIKRTLVRVAGNIPNRFVEWLQLLVHLQIDLFVQPVVFFRRL